MKKKLFALAFGLCVFALVGVLQVKAFGNGRVVCLPHELETGKTAKCYIVGQFDHGDIYAIYTRAITKDLNVKKVTSTQPTVATGDLVVGTLTDKGKSPSGLYTCLTVADDGTSAPTGFKDDGCAYFESKATTAKSIKSTYTSTEAKTLDIQTSFAEIGYYEVELADTAKDKNCGYLCAQIYYLETADDTVNSSTGLLTKGGYQNAIDGNLPNKYSCGELTIKKEDEPEVTPTGNFASYAVLIAGACIAVAAIAISTKNKKIYRV